MADDPQPRRVLRPVELAPEEAAAVYDLYNGGEIGRARVHAWSDLLRKVEAAMEPPPPEGRLAPPAATRPRRSRR